MTPLFFQNLPNFIQDGMWIENDGVFQFYQPFFLYEAIINLLGWIIINKIIKNITWFKPGTHAGMYLFWYGITRASMENFRSEEYIMKIGNFHTSFAFAILFALIGFMMIIYYQFYYWKVKYFLDYEKKIYFSYLKKRLKLLFIFSDKNLNLEYYRSEKKLALKQVKIYQKDYNKNNNEIYIKGIK